MVTNIDPELIVLRKGTMTLKGEFLWGSNYTFFVEVEHQGKIVQGVYKPAKGERPLWDFPAASLSRREAAAYLVSEALGWRLVPPTVYRKKGPIGSGSLQLYIQHDPEYHYFNFTDQDVQRLRPVVVFDLLINNADRKGSHVVKAPDDHLWLIDHGVCFHVEDKLRSVIWNFVGESIPVNLCDDLTKFQHELSVFLQPKRLDDEIQEGSQPRLLPVDTGNLGLLCKLLSRVELRALARRAEKIIDNGVFPAPDPNRRPFPWPQI